MIRIFAILTVLAVSSFADACHGSGLFGRFQVRRDARHAQPTSQSAADCSACQQPQAAVVPAAVPAPIPETLAPTKLFLPRGHHRPAAPAGKVWTRVTCSRDGCDYVLIDKK